MLSLHSLYLFPVPPPQHTHTRAPPHILLLGCWRSGHRPRPALVCFPGTPPPPSLCCVICLSPSALHTWPSSLPQTFQSHLRYFPYPEYSYTSLLPRQIQPTVSSFSLIAGHALAPYKSDCQLSVCVLFSKQCCRHPEDNDRSLYSFVIFPCFVLRKCSIH